MPSSEKVSVGTLPESETAAAPCVESKSGERIECPVIIEIFCGSARVTASLISLGLDSSFGVDHQRKSTGVPIRCCDLTTTKGQKLLFTWLASPLVKGVFLAPDPFS